MKQHKKRVLVPLVAILLLGLFGMTALAGSPENKPVTIVLDPGHDQIHAGTPGVGTSEEFLTLKIAQAAKAELERYEGVNVYLTRQDMNCLDSGSERACLHARVNYAASVGADVFVSLHLNSYTNDTPRGVEAYVGDDHYRPDLGAQSRSIASSIVQELGTLGIQIRPCNMGPGIQLNYMEGNPDPEFWYPNGTTGNYYNVIRNSIRAGFPGLIVEHAYINNPQDYAEFLSTDEKLQRLGIADATALAKYYGLKLKGQSQPQTSSSYISLSDPIITDITPQGYTISCQVESSAPITQVMMPTWTENNGQDEIIWYSAVVNGNTATCYIPTAEHNSESGNYITHIYASDANGGNSLKGVQVQVPMQ